MGMTFGEFVHANLVENSDKKLEDIVSTWEKFDKNQSGTISW